MSAGHVLQSALPLSVKTAARPGHVVQPGRADRPQHHRRVGLRPASGIHTTDRGERQQRPLRFVGGDQPPTKPCQCTQILCSTIDSVSRFGAVGQRGVDPASSDPIGGLHRPQAASPRFRKAVHRLASGGEHRRSRGSGQGSLATKVYQHRTRDGCAVRSVAAAGGVLRDCPHGNQRLGHQEETLAHDARIAEQPCHFGAVEQVPVRAGALDPEAIGQPEQRHQRAPREPAHERQQLWLSIGKCL